MEFQLKDQEFIELMKLLKFTGLTDTGADAKCHIDNGEVMVNGKQEYRRRNKLSPTCAQRTVSFCFSNIHDPRIWFSGNTDFFM